MMAMLVTFFCRRRNLRVSSRLGPSWISSFALPTSWGFVPSSPSPLIFPPGSSNMKKLLLHTGVEHKSKSMIYMISKEPTVFMTGHSTRLPHTTTWMIRKDDRDAGISQGLEILERDLISEEALLGLYEQWLSHYNTLDTEHKRFNVFKDNVYHIHRVNDMNKDYKLRLNKFGDLTNREFLKLYVELKTFQDQMIDEIRRATGTASFVHAHVTKFPPPHVWRKKEVKDQDQCGRKCDTEEITLLEQVATRPVLVSIDAGSSDFQFYSEGLFDGELGDEMNHVIAIIGYGTYTNGKTKWIIANSLGPEWGENGFMTIKRDVCVKEGLCWIATMASYLIKISPQQLNLVPQSFMPFRHLGIKPTLKMNCSSRSSGYLKSPSFTFNMPEKDPQVVPTPAASRSYLQGEPQMAPTNSTYEFQSSGSNPTFMMDRSSRPSSDFIFPPSGISTIVGDLLSDTPTIVHTIPNSRVPTLVDWRNACFKGISEGLDVGGRDLESEEAIWNLYHRWMDYSGDYAHVDIERKYYEVFKKNAKHIHRFNSIGAPFKLRLNSFADETDQSFQQLFLESSPSQRQAIAEICKLIGASRLRCSAVAKFRSRTKEAAFIPVLDKGRYRVEELGLDIFKMSHMKNNGGGTNNESCMAQGGTYETDTFKSSEATISSEGHDEMDDESCEVTLMNAVARQPVLVAIDAGSLDFRFYSEGVFDGELGESPNEVVAIVGYGVTHDGIKYWIIANTWGSWWGESGFMRIKRGVYKTTEMHAATMASYLIKISP